MKSNQHHLHDQDGPLSEKTGPVSGTGPRENDSMVISLSDLIALEHSLVTETSKPRAPAGDDEPLDLSLLPIDNDQDRPSYLAVFPLGLPTGSPEPLASAEPARAQNGILVETDANADYSEAFPFGPPSRSLFGRPSELTPVPAEVLLAPMPTEQPRRRATRYAAISALAAAVVASVVWLGAPRPTLAGPAQAGIVYWARAAQASLPKIEAPPSATAQRDPDAQSEKDRSTSKRSKKRPAKSGGARPAKGAAAPTPAAAEAPKPPPARVDTCDLACAMARATGG